MVDFGAATKGAERAILPTDRREMVNGRLLIRNEFQEIEQALKFRSRAHRILDSISADLGQARI